MTTAVRTIDLRSDTVTLPSPSMRQAIANAEMGDDLLGDDPTTKHLEAMAAERMGKEAAIFVASGTMGNVCGSRGKAPGVTAFTRMPARAHSTAKNRVSASTAPLFVA